MESLISFGAVGVGSLSALMFITLQMLYVEGVDRSVLILLFLIFLNTLISFSIVLNNLSSLI